MLLPAFIAVTLVEIYILVSVGKTIGGFYTVVLVAITAFIGLYLLKQQGFAMLAKAQQSIKKKTPAFSIFEGIVIFISGVLLLARFYY